MIEKSKKCNRSAIYLKWDRVGWMIEKVKIEQNCKIISKVGLGGVKWDERFQKVKV